MYTVQTEKEGRKKQMKKTVMIGEYIRRLADEVFTALENCSTEQEFKEVQAVMVVKVHYLKRKLEVLEKRIENMEYTK